MRIFIISWLMTGSAQAGVVVVPKQCPTKEKCPPTADASSPSPKVTPRPLSIPLIFRAQDIDPIANYPIRHLRVFRALATGEAIPIPFQIDELNRYGDFLFDNASNVQERGNKIFDRLDELSIMSGDLGVQNPPTKWTHGKPFRLYEVVTNVQHQRNTFYVGVFLGNKKPPLSSKVYVKFDAKQAIIDTANYRLLLNKKNYLAIEEVLFKLPERNMSLIDWSSFHLKLDFKYFLTIEENHESIESKMSAYKSGAIRTIIKIDFILQLLKLKLNPGFFTEMSFFGGSLLLPALIYAPFDNQKILNRGSEMYYGFALVENPNTLHIETNMPRYQVQEIAKPSKLHYWLGVYSPFYAVFVNLRSNRMLRANQFAPNLFTTNQSASQLPPTKKSGNRKVNVALYFDLTKFAKGEQKLGFQSFFVSKRQDIQKNLTATDFAIHRLFATSIQAIRQE